MNGLAKSAIVAGFLAYVVALPGAIAASNAPPASAPNAQAMNVQVVGENPLFNRGMNAALAIYKNWVYIGNRTDSSSVCVGETGNPSGDTCPHPHPGILIVDVKNPAHPEVVGEIGPPYAGNVGITTRELRVWPDKKLLIVMNFRCSALIHACKAGTDEQYPFDISFFDLRDPLQPKFLSKYVPTSAAGRQVKPHEMFLWTDVNDKGRALLYLSTPTIQKDPSIPNLIAVDISKVAQGGPVVEVAEGNWNNLYRGTDRADYPFVDAKKGVCGPYDCNLFVHSMGISADGLRAYLAMEAGQMLVLSTSDVQKASKPDHIISLNTALISSPPDRPVWGQTPANANAVPDNCKKACANGHSAVKVPSRPLVLTTDEVYGTFTDPKFGCPWGWERLIDITDEGHPKIMSEYAIPQDAGSFCGSPADDTATEQYTSYSSHNPTVLPNLAIMTWHSGGVQIVDISNPAHQERGGFFSPTPLAHVATEDPALTRGPNKVAMWSYPIIKDGLIYVVDVRNGLYILRYTGKHADDLGYITFLEGNSNLGDADRLDGVYPPPKE